MSTCKVDFSDWGPKQLEIEYFFPLIEQIDLDLDFTQCTPHQYWYRAKGIAGLHGPISTGMKYKK